MATAKIENMNAPLLPVSVATQMSSEVGGVIASSGGRICDCFSDLGTCCVGWVCPCWLFGRNLRESGQSTTAWTGCLPYTGLVAVGVVGFVALTMIFDGMLHACDTLSPDGSGSTADWSESRDCGFFASLWFLRSYLLLKVGTLCSFGALCGFWYRERIGRFLGASQGARLGSWLVHCCPLTHQLALCQEARALKAAEVTYGGF